MKMTTYVEGFDLNNYLTAGVEKIVKSVLRATLKDPKESAFMMGFAKASRKASKKRADAEAKGEHVPPFLIASITSSCNLHCAGCYARHNHACSDEEIPGQMSDEEWLKIFREAKDMGVGFILLAGGEPLLRRDIIRAAGKNPDILFPIFTNGTLIDDKYIELFDQCRNLVPIFSIEGQEDTTDERRGGGVYRQLLSGMEKVKENGLIFGASVTVTTDNLKEVTSEAFIESLQEKGCKAVIFVEYVPVTEESQSLAPQDPDREYMAQQIMKLRESYQEMLFVSFPGDEKSSGGCLAAGRGFFHINAHGGAEPCPFSPYSDINVKETSLKEALDSKLFRMLQQEEILAGDHSGGCVLFEQQEKVEELLKNI